MERASPAGQLTRKRIFQSGPTGPINCSESEASQLSEPNLNEDLPKFSRPVFKHSHHVTMFQASSFVSLEGKQVKKLDKPIFRKKEDIYDSNPD